MRRHQVLNPEVRTREHDPVGLTRQLLETVRKGGVGSTRTGPLTAQLGGTDPTSLENDDSRTAFWLNVYNALVGHWLGLHPPGRSILRELRLFGRAAYFVGDLSYTPNQIEHGLLRGNRRPPYQPRRTLRDGDPRLLAGPSREDPRIHFALNCGAHSCPPISSYRAEDLDAQLRLATRSYLSTETEFDPERGRITLPGLMRLYRGDFGSKESAVRFVAHHVPAIETALANASTPHVSYGKFDWTSLTPAADPPPAGP